MITDLSDFNTLINMFGQLFAGWISVADSLLLFGPVSLLSFLVGLAIVSTFVFFVFRSVSMHYRADHQDGFRFKEFFGLNQKHEMGFHGSKK